MTASCRGIPLRRDVLARELRRLPPLDLHILIQLALTVHPQTGRLTATPERFAEDLGLPPPLLRRILERLAADDLLETFPAPLPGLLTIELGTVFLRAASAPMNLPVESDDV